MTVFIALLRAVNVGGKGMVRMADIRDVCGKLGYGDGQTVLQSGNIVFSAKGAAAKIAASLEAALASDLGLRTTVMVRTAAALDAAIAANPFPDVAKEEPGRLLVGFLSGKPLTDATERLASIKVNRERLSLHGQELFIHYADGVGRSKVTTAVLERALGVSVTARNWNTVTKLQALVAAKSG